MTRFLYKDLFFQKSLSNMLEKISNRESGGGGGAGGDGGCKRR